MSYLMSSPDTETFASIHILATSHNNTRWTAELLSTLLVSRSGPVAGFPQLTSVLHTDEKAFSFQVKS